MSGHEDHSDLEWHAEWTERFSDYLDDELPADERQAVEEHVRGCAPCAAVLDELRRVVDAAAALDHVPPGEHVWQAVSAQVRELPRTSRLSAGRRFSFTLPQLAAASVLLALLSGWGALRMMTTTGNRPPMSAGATAPSSETVKAVNVGDFEYSDPDYDAAVSDLEQALERGRGRLDPDTVATVQGDLRIIDQALEDARRALVADPANSYLSDHVVDTRQRKLDLLRRAAAMTTDSQM